MRFGGKTRDEERRAVIQGQEPPITQNGESSHAVNTYDSKLEITYDKQDMKLLSFKQWHRRMQLEHDLKYGTRIPSYSSWRWCNSVCSPCRYFDAVDYDKQLCRYFLRFRTLKAWTTGFFIGGFTYVILFDIFGDDILPGGTYFYLLVMFLTAFVVGNILLSYGVPGTLGQIVVGIIFSYLPIETDQDKTINVISFSEKFMLLIIVIRAALLLDFGHLYHQVGAVAQLAFIPYSVEYAVIIICGHYLMELPWMWSAVLGVLVAPVSLASALFTLDKWKSLILSENSKIPTVIIAAVSIQIIITIYVFSILIAIIFSEGGFWTSTWWSLLIAVLVQVLGGIVIGIILGFLAGMFPDRRGLCAPYGRILFIGTGSMALFMGFNGLGMLGVGVLSTLTMIVIASNIWEALGWHESSNPVLFFYSEIFYYTLPIGVSLVGFSMKFHEIDAINIAISIAVVAMGTTVRLLFCLAVLGSQSMRTNRAEKMFIIFCWLPKGTSEILLAALLDELVHDNYEYMSIGDYTLEQLLKFVETILQTTVIGMIITGPISSLLTTFLIPILSRKIKASSSSSTTTT